MIECKNLSKSYGTLQAVRGISLSLYEKESLSILGPSGCGKSTLLRLLQGQNNPDIGNITIDGETLARARSQVALMPQRSSMNWKFPITVEKLVSLGQIKYSKSNTHHC